MSDQPALFEVNDPDPDRTGQACSVGTCTTAAWASDDALRVRGWLVFDGRSLAGQPLHIRICPSCQRRFRRATGHTSQILMEQLPLVLLPSGRGDSEASA